MPRAVENISQRLLTIEATGDRSAATTLLAESGVISSNMQSVLNRLTTIPIDIHPMYSPELSV